MGEVQLSGLLDYGFGLVVIAVCAMRMATAKRRRRGRDSMGRPLLGTQPQEP